MKMKACLVLAVAALSGSVAVASDYVPGEVIVAFSRRAALGLINETAADYGGVVTTSDKVAGYRLALMAFPPEAGTVEELVAALSAAPGVEYAEPNYIVRNTSPIRPSRPHRADILRLRTGLDDQGRPTYRNAATPLNTFSKTFPADDHALNKWAWCDIGASVVWRLGRPGVPVVLLGTGVDFKHPDLRGRVKRGRDWVNNDRVPMDDNGTGTHMAGIIGAITGNRKGISGLSRCRITAIKMLDANGVGTHYNAARALNEAYSKGKIIVIGWGGPDEGLTMRYFIKRLVDGNRMIVAAAGDAGTDVPQYPAAYSTWMEPDQPATFNKGVLSVAAAGTWVTPSSGGDDVFVEYARAPYSNYGPWVNVTAPGTDITSATPDDRPFTGLDAGDAPDGYNIYSGTAMAAAEAAGALAHVWGIFRAAPIHVFHRVTGQEWPALPAFTGPVDVDDDGVNELETAWDPVSSQPSAERPFELVNFNMAHALARSAAWGRLYDAGTGGTLDRGWARILSNYHCAKKYNVASAGIGKDGNLGTAEFDILRIPWNDCKMRFRVNKRNVTNGSKEYGFPLIIDGHQNPRKIYYQAEDLAVPPPNGTSCVVNWGGTDEPIDLDLHLLLPSTEGEVCDVGPSPALALDPATFCGSGALTSPPYAQLLVESQDNGVSFEALRFPKLTNTPVDLPYSFFVVNNETTLPAHGYLAARLWSGGNIAFEVHAGDGTVVQTDPLCSLLGGEADCRVWLPFTMDVVPSGRTQRRLFSILNEFGDGVNLAAIPF